MSFPTDYYSTKILFDLAGYLASFLVTFFFSKRVFRPGELPSPFSCREQKWEYMLTTIAGAMLGGILISTFDGYMIPGRNPEHGILISKSIAGALFGGVITAEIYKWYAKISTPTGILFLPGIIIGVFVGRFGAIATGIRDFTYGLPTTLPWGMDFGDGIARHPTMIYEMILLFCFFVIFCRGLFSTHRQWWIERGFSAFILTYFIYRFFVGFIQPYSTWWLELSTYQVISIPMVVYAVVMLRRKRF